MSEEGHWNIITASLQDVCNTNESTHFDNIYADYLSDPSKIPTSEEELEKLVKEVSDHKSNIETAKRLIETCQQNLQILITSVQKHSSAINTRQSRGSTAKIETNTLSTSTPGNKAVSKSNTKKQKKVGRSFHTSKLNWSEPIIVGSEVAYKLRNRHSEEWIQCEVTKIIGDGVKFEVRDPEPDENNNPGQTFKANYREVILIVPEAEIASNPKILPNYTYGAKVLARYPETTTFYPAMVVGTKKDTTVKLKFDGEEEANKETEVERRLVLPFPEKS
ncbi:hypothetical protein CANTEDRAFT_117615 [Yamadazyma tenuis ATCC 10573]|uniref:SGF29 C-terminal domain-containing protein n=2 Tax=Candida tenuis TaxID=2315449 RepID=G3AWN0_CANTC|nr:uncharacterized protein CANTEDRAFT_117615 [Yamadazyma tenuis ATCC 10573]XP_006683832.1 uncharacterized protein CANTEDRAFT_117615 [Yamadazyma tenuis ATCC 10573]EGV66573.1 hypothetical protein CANTEDRAFT_117615 [Yamadazyma tenuis ATCC 10573]EGV66574.1 hypothetical protein CANTEDRAFT_117615 [Yamadazyma tenuis ATCC 10573]